jgi:hypothetical protein
MGPRFWKFGRLEGARGLCISLPFKSQLFYHKRKHHMKIQTAKWHFGLWISVLTVLFPAAAHSQIGPEQIISNPAFPGTSVIHVADLNGDGVLGWNWDRETRWAEPDYYGMWTGFGSVHQGC